MKIYVDFKNHIQTEKDKFPFDMGQNLENKVEVYVVNNITETYYPQMQFITPDGRKPILYNPDALQTGQTGLVTVDGTQYKYYAFTLTDEITKKPGRLQISCYINFTTLGTNNVVLVTKRALLFDCMNEIKKATGYTSNTMLFVDTNTDGEQVVTDFRTFINSYAALISQKVNTADLLAGTLNPKFKYLTVTETASAKNFSSKNYIAEFAIPKVDYPDLYDYVYGWLKYEIANPDEVEMEGGEVAKIKANLYADYFTWNGKILATQEYANRLIYEFTQSNNTWNGIQKFKKAVNFGDYNNLSIYTSGFSAYTKFADPWYICDSNDNYIKFGNGDINIYKPTTFATAPTISQLQQSDNSAVTRKFVNDSVSEAMKEHVIDQWFTEDDVNGTYTLNLKLNNGTIKTATFTIPANQILKNAELVTYQNKLQLKMTFVNGQVTYADMSNLTDVYEADNNGNNVVVTITGNKISANLTSATLSQLNTAFTNEQTRITNETARQTNYNAFFNTIDGIEGSLGVMSIDAEGNVTFTEISYTRG